LERQEASVTGRDRSQRYALGARLYLNDGRWNGVQLVSTGPKRGFLVRITYVR
jgi:hypothetical protein